MSYMYSVAKLLIFLYILTHFCKISYGLITISGVKGLFYHHLLPVFYKHTLLQPKDRSVARIRGLRRQATALDVGDRVQHHF